MKKFITEIIDCFYWIFMPVDKYVQRERKKKDRAMGRESRRIRRDKNPLKNNEKEFSFIWYKELKNANKTFYTQPFRTKVMAENLEEAKQKVAEFAMGKMKLIIHEEESFSASDMNRFNEAFEDIHTKMEELFKSYETK